MSADKLSPSDKHEILRLALDQERAGSHRKSLVDFLDANLRKLASTIPASTVEILQAKRASSLTATPATETPKHRPPASSLTETPQLRNTETPAPRLFSYRNTATPKHRNTGL